MTRFVFPLLIVFALALTACDATDILGGGPEGQPSQAEAVLVVAEPFVPNGVPRLVLDMLMLGAAFAARKLSKRELAANEAREYTTEEAQSMLAAIAMHKDELHKDQTDAKNGAS